MMLWIRTCSYISLVRLKYSHFVSNIPRCVRRRAKLRSNLNIVVVHNYGMRIVCLDARSLLTRSAPLSEIARKYFPFTGCELYATINGVPYVPSTNICFVLHIYIEYSYLSNNIHRLHRMWKLRQLDRRKASLDLLGCANHLRILFTFRFIFCVVPINDF